MTIAQHEPDRFPTYNGRRVVLTHLLPPKRIWTRPGPVPSKAAGRRGTRRSWKRSHPPRFVERPDLPRDALVMGSTLYVDQPTYDRLVALSERYRNTLEVAGRNAGQLADVYKALGAAAEQGGYKVAGFASAMSSLRDYDHSQPITPIIDRVLAPLRGQT